MLKFKVNSFFKASFVGVTLFVLTSFNLISSLPAHAAEDYFKYFKFSPVYDAAQSSSQTGNPRLTFQIRNKTNNTVTNGMVLGKYESGNIQFEETGAYPFDNNEESEICFKELDVGCQAITKGNGSQTIPIGGYDVSADNLTNSASSEEATSGDIEECVANNRYIGWAVCGPIKAGLDAVDFIYKELLVPLLQVEKIESADNSGQPTPLYKMWEVVRNISISASVAVILFILLGSQLSFIGGGDEKSLFSSYSIKKSLPRLIIAIALIIFSFEISKILVDVFNILGSSIDNFVNTILQTSGVPMVKIQGGTNTLLVIGEVLAVLSIGKIPGLISGLMLAMALIGILATFVTLVLRKVLIYTAIVMAPIAFLINAIPMRHNQAFELWKDIFFKSLFLYPLISILLASSKLLSAITSNTNNSAPGALGGLGSIVSQLTSILIALLPLMIVPLAFKVAGKSLSTINGILTQFGSGGKKLIKGSKWAEKSEQRRHHRDLAIKTGLGMNFFGKRVLGVKKQLANGEEVDNKLGRLFTSSAANDPWRHLTMGNFRRNLENKSAVGIAEEASIGLGEMHKHLVAEGVLDDKVKTQVLLRGKVGSNRMIEEEKKKYNLLDPSDPRRKIIQQNIHELEEYQEEMRPLWNNGLARMAAALQLVETGDVEEEDFMHVARMMGNTHGKHNKSNAYFVNHVFKIMGNNIKGKYPHLGFLKMDGNYDLDELEKFFNSRNSNQLLEFKGGAVAKAAELGVLSAINFPVLINTSYQYGSQQMRRATNDIVRLQHIMHDDHNIIPQQTGLTSWLQEEIAAQKNWNHLARTQFQGIDFSLPKNIITDLNMLTFLTRDNTPNANNLRLRVKRSLESIPDNLSAQLYSQTIDNTIEYDNATGTYYTTVVDPSNPSRRMRVRATLPQIDSLSRNWQTFMAQRSKFINNVDSATGALTNSALITVQDETGLDPQSPPYVAPAYNPNHGSMIPANWGR